MKRIAAQIGMVTSAVLLWSVAGMAGNQAGSMVTVSGCLMQMSSAGSVMGGSASEGLTPQTEPINQPSTASPTDEERFVLANARAESASGSDSVTSAQRYLVAGLKRDDLRKYINHQVELSGRVAEPTPSSSLDDTTPSAAARLIDLPRLDATSLRLIAGACSTPGSND